MAAHEHARVEGRLVTAPFIILLIVVFLATIVLTQRFVFGIGAATNLNDGYPWGIWIAIDLIVGTALGCAGFVLALLIYILNKGEYHPMARVGLMTSLFGYTLGGLAVMIDLGRYWQGYNIVLPWLVNVNTVLLETALCIFAYILVLLVEFAPTVFERFGMKEARKKVHRVLFVFTGLGVLLPMMHQSSMGTVVVLLGHQLSPLWQSPMLTPNFLLTAFTMGYAIVAFESVIASVGLKRPIETDILSKLTVIMLWVMGIYMVIRYGDVLISGTFTLAFAGDIKSVWFLLELLFGLATFAFLLPKANRSSPRYIFLGATAMLLNGVFYRMGCYLVGYQPGNGWSYFPSSGEIMVTLGIFALEVILYLVFVKQLPVLHAVKRA